MMSPMCRHFLKVLMGVNFLQMDPPIRLWGWGKRGLIQVRKVESVSVSEL